MKWLLVPYNLGLVALSVYMFYEVRIKSLLFRINCEQRPLYEERAIGPSNPDSKKKKKKNALEMIFVLDK